MIFYGFESLLRSAPDSLSKLGYGLSSGLSGSQKDLITGLIKSYYYFFVCTFATYSGTNGGPIWRQACPGSFYSLLFIGLLSGFASPDYSYLIYGGRFLIGAGSAFAFVCVITTATYLVPDDINFASGYRQVLAYCSPPILVLKSFKSSIPFNPSLSYPL